MTDRTPLREDLPNLDILVTMSEGNPGAISVLSQLMRGDHGIADVLNLEDMNMRGSQIWVAYKDHCGQDIAKLCRLVRERDPGMIETVNQEMGRGGSEEVAVRSKRAS